MVFVTRRNSKKEPETLNAMLHGRDAKSQWFGLSAEWSFGGHKPIYFWECAREDGNNNNKNSDRRMNSRTIRCVSGGVILGYSRKKDEIHKRWTVFSFSLFIFLSSSFLGSEEFYLCNIAIWPIQKKKKKLAHTFGHTKIFCLVHAHTLGRRILSPESVKGDYVCAMRKNSFGYCIYHWNWDKTMERNGCIGLRIRIYFDISFGFSSQVEEELELSR